MRRLVGALAALLAIACGRAERAPAPLVDARLGVFFGGQVQERDEIPFELDRTRQSQGFRLDLSRVEPKAHHVRWEIERPPGKPGARRVTALADADLRPEQARFDQLIAFQPGDPLGLWNVRVLLDGEIVLDRAILVYDAAARRRALADGGA
ncbi:MAG: hypothetical protein OZ921_13330 [Sorangiineae bacterium]|nr:hypothetical protein [Polyangiaceae bacterium]MEB2323487.1 hypothetical protein [Sorangiineae bacterium]